MPQLALSHETSADGKTVTIKLRPGVKFHDGEAVRRRRRQVQPRPPPQHEGLVPQARARRRSTRVEVVDPLTIKLNLKAPFSPLLAQLTDRAGMMVSPKAAEAAGDKFGLKPVCAGPYKFVERVQQDRIVVEKFADYWNKDQVFIDKITYLPIVDATVRLANLQLGRPRPDRARARHRHQDGARRSQAQAQQGGVDRLVRPAGQRRQRAQGRQSAGQGRPRAPAPSSSRSTARR